MSSTIKQILFILGIVVFFFLLKNPGSNNTPSFERLLNDIEHCLEDQEVTLVESPKEMFQMCSNESDDLDDISLCMENTNIQVEDTPAELFKQCKKSIFDFYDYVDSMSESQDSYEPRVR